MPVEVAAVAEEEEEEAGVEAAKGPAKAAEGRPALDANPWRSLPQRLFHRWEGQAVFHEKSGIP